MWEQKLHWWKTREKWMLSVVFETRHATKLRYKLTCCPRIFQSCVFTGVVFFLNFLILYFLVWLVRVYVYSIRENVSLDSRQYRPTHAISVVLAILASVGSVNSVNSIAVYSLVPYIPIPAISICVFPPAFSVPSCSVTSKKRIRRSCCVTAAATRSQLSVLTKDQNTQLAWTFKHPFNLQSTPTHTVVIQGLKELSSHDPRCTEMHRFHR